MAPVPTAAPTLPPCHKNGPGGQKRRKYGAILVVAEHHCAGAAVHRNLRGVATMSEATLPAPLYLKSARFDRMFVLGIPLLALATGALALGFPGYFFLILSFDLAFLGYHHVVSTYTRLLFDLKSARQHWLLLIPCRWRCSARSTCWHTTPAWPPSPPSTCTGSGTTTRARA